MINKANIITKAEKKARPEWLKYNTSLFSHKYRVR